MERNAKDKAGEASSSREERVPLVEERLEIGRRVVDGRTVSVTTSVEEEDVAISEKVRREDVTVERVPVGAVVDTMPATREEGDLTVIPVVEERIRVVCELVLVEEIHLRRKSSTSTHREDVTVKKTNVSIDDGREGPEGR